MEEFIAVLVLYKSGLKESKTFLSICRSLEKNNQELDLVVYDNTPEYNDNLPTGVSTIGNVNVTYCQDYDNSGVSKAYNTGQAIGKLRGKKWIILFDQDTSFPENTITKYIEATHAFPNEKLFSPIMVANGKTIISPCHFKFMRGFSVKEIKTGINSLNNFSVINCGMCIDIKSFDQNKGYNELIKLDFSDHDFVKRFKKTVTDRFIVIDLKVHHELSSTSKNSKYSDLVRFDYYLEGSKYISSSLIERSFLKFNSTMRGLKLSLIHRSFSFLNKILK